MKVLTVGSEKGGVGKTMMARLLSEYFARNGKRVLGIDLDPQCNYSRRFLSMEHDTTTEDGIQPPIHPDYETGSEATDPWNGRSASPDIYTGRLVVPYQTDFETLEVLPGDGARLRELEHRAEEVPEGAAKALHSFLWREAVTAEYDIVIIDTAPSKGPLTVSALQAATHLIIPAIMEPQSIEGLYGMIQLWKQQNRLKSDGIDIVGIIPNKVRRVALHQGFLDYLRGLEGISNFVAPLQLGDRIAFAESDYPGARPQSVFELSPSDPARQEALKFCGFVAEHIDTAEMA